MLTHCHLSTLPESIEINYVLVPESCTLVETFLEIEWGLGQSYKCFLEDYVQGWMMLSLSKI